MVGPGISVGYHDCHSQGLRFLALVKKGIIMKASPMSDEFHDWLDQCPVMWFRGEVTKDHVTYSFETPNEDEEDE